MLLVEITKTFFELLNKHDFQGIAKYLHPMFDDQFPYKETIGEMIANAHSTILSAFPDVQYERQEKWTTYNETNLLATFYLIGTHQGEFLGVKPTGKNVQIGGMFKLEVINSKITSVAVQTMIGQFFTSVGVNFVDILKEAKYVDVANYIEMVKQFDIIE